LKTLTKGNTDLITVNQIGNGLKFNGTNQSTFTPSPASIFNFGTGNFSISTIVNVISLNPVDGIVFSVYNGVPNYSIYVLSTGVFYATIRNSAGNSVVITSPTISLNRTYQVTMVRNGTSLLLYVDGVLVNTGTNALITNINVSNTYLTIGGVNADINPPVLQPANTNFQNMILYDFKIFNNNITVGQINQLYTSFGNNISGLESNIVVNYNFNQKSGTQATDNSPNQLHTTLNSFGATSNLGGGAWVNSLGSTITY
jgi:hypothetical protein